MWRRHTKQNYENFNIYHASDSLAKLSVRTITVNGIAYGIETLAVNTNESYDEALKIT